MAPLGISPSLSHTLYPSLLLTCIWYIERGISAPIMRINYAYVLFVVSKQFAENALHIRKAPRERHRERERGRDGEGERKRRTSRGN